MEVTGIIKQISETQKVSDRFQKRDFVLTTDSTTPYPQHVQFQVAQDKCSLLDRFEIGQEVKVMFNLKGREHNGNSGIKYYNTLEAWRIESGNEEKEHHYAAGSAENNPKSDFNDDLPF